MKLNAEYSSPDIDTHESVFTQEIAPKLRFVEPLRQLVFAYALEAVHDLKYCNQALTQAGRPDLVIEQPAEMLDIRTPFFMGAAEWDIPSSNRGPDTFNKGNNYLHNFRIFGADGNRSPISKQELQRLKEGNFQIQPSFTQAEVKPSTVRMLLIPELAHFTEDLIQDMTSDNDILNLKHHHDQRLYMAYQMQRKLVDINDPGVLQDDGTVDPRYLTR